MVKIIRSKGTQTRAKVGTGVMYHRLRDFFLSGQNISIRLVCVCVLVQNEDQLYIFKSIVV